MARDRQPLTGRMGRSNGNGPWHLLAENEAALCGVKRVAVHYVASAAPRDVCSACRRVRRESNSHGEVG